MTTTTTPRLHDFDAQGNCIRCGRDKREALSPHDEPCPEGETVSLRARALGVVAAVAAEEADNERRAREARRVELIEAIQERLTRAFSFTDLPVPTLHDEGDPLAEAASTGAVSSAASVEVEGLLFVMSSWDRVLYVAVECIGCHQRRALYRIGTTAALRELGYALSQEEQGVTECAACYREREDAELKGRATPPPPKRAAVSWPEDEDTEHRLVVGIAQNLAVIADRLDTIAQELPNAGQGF